jgi:hypothetical protein
MRDGMNGRFEEGGEVRYAVGRCRGGGDRRRVGGSERLRVS